MLTAGAISLLLAPGARGPLGTEPCEEVAMALAGLSSAGRVVGLPACLVCGLAGEVWTLPGRIAPGDRHSEARSRFSPDAYVQTLLRIADEVLGARAIGDRGGAAGGGHAGPG